MLGSVTAKAAGTTTRPTYYQGLPILDMNVGDPIPAPARPERFAVRVSPLLASYLLTFNHPRNRTFRRKAEAYAADMKRKGGWVLTPEAIVFSKEGILQNGQNRLLAVTMVPNDVWLVLDFGWPEIINFMDRGSAKSNGDSLKVIGASGTNILAGAMGIVHRYDVIVGTAKSPNNVLAPTSPQVIDWYQSEPDIWAAAVTTGGRTYVALDYGMSPSAWAAGYYVLRRVHSAPVVDAFFTEVTEGTGAPRTASRTLADFWRRRPVTNTISGDMREPMETIIRAFNAHRAGRSPARVTRPGFEMSKVTTK